MLCWLEVQRLFGPMADLFPYSLISDLAKLTHCGDYSFEAGFLLVALAAPGTHSLDQAGLKLRDPLASASRVLG